MWHRLHYLLLILHLLKYLEINIPSFLETGLVLKIPKKDKNNLTYSKKIHSHTMTIIQSRTIQFWLILESGSSPKNIYIEFCWLILLTQNFYNSDFPTWTILSAPFIDSPVMVTCRIRRSFSILTATTPPKYLSCRFFTFSAKPKQSLDFVKSRIGIERFRNFPLDFNS